MYRYAQQTLANLAMAMTGPSDARVRATEQTHAPICIVCKACWIRTC